jgi:DNA-binding MarR family transcriptional regulator
MHKWTNTEGRRQKRLKLTDSQKAAYKDLQDTRAKARADRIAAFCDSKPDLSSFEKRLAFRGGMLQRRLDMFKAVEPKLLAFDNSLDDKQKKQFVELRQNMMHQMMEHGGGHQGDGGGWNPLHPETDLDFPLPCGDRTASAPAGAVFLRPRGGSVQDPSTISKSRFPYLQVLVGSQTAATESRFAAFVERLAAALGHVDCAKSLRGSLFVTA